MSTGRDGSASNDSNTLRKRQRLLGNVEVDEDTVMAENDEDVNDEEEMPDAAQETPRLLLGSPDLDESHPSTRWLSDHHSIQIIKIVTVVLKVTYALDWCNTFLTCSSQIASCSYSCSPYSAKPGALYPVIMFALLDFWSESSSPSFLLMVVHVVWIMSTTLLTGGLCEA